MDTVNAATIPEIAHRATGIDRVETEAHLDFDHWRDEGQQILTRTMRAQVEHAEAMAPRRAQAAFDLVASWDARERVGRIGRRAPARPAEVVFTTSAASSSRRGSSSGRVVIARV